MPAANPDLHGMVPDRASVALILLDVINALEFDGGERLLVHARPAAERIAALKERAKRARIPVIYVNDNYGRWQSDFTRLIAHCLEDDVPGRPLVEILRPADDDYFVLKPKHSGFYSTQLDVLLQYLTVRTVILTGFAGNICVLYTANDAYMRDFRIVVPADCVASEDPGENAYALRQMQRFLKADVRPSGEIDLDALVRESDGDQGSTRTPRQNAT
jgi:nicotinamidase-related amidase